ncbi:hypothetical protein WOLCODRAFT_22134 [Wolfiporia cocos MD-104 SS10]|uniref:Protein CPL1-like domain-containing protein n=1 Tax=Wolfiporia cocos (strain MD-104) TaxID=742152 RepID=A0A2H3IUI4_WOLCO|nr:hypothetical protein WOLCODRAFT_22134 [Wolfiporia cocos MD-104 SS10]
MARFTSLLLVAAALPFVLADSSNTSSLSSQCSDAEFYYDLKSCCLPYGGQPNPPTPPQGTNQCPTSGWEWHTEKECCVPQQPPEQNPPPQCGGGWEWNHGSSTCCEPTTTTALATSTPSGKTASGNWRKRHLKSRATHLCPDSMEACPIQGLSGLTGDYECLDTAAELESCGGCASTGAGQDCTAIEGVKNVGCEHGHCAIYTCAQGYKLSTDGQSCVSL